MYCFITMKHLLLPLADSIIFLLEYQADMDVDRPLPEILAQHSALVASNDETNASAEVRPDNGYRDEDTDERYEKVDNGRFFYISSGLEIFYAS